MKQIFKRIFNLRGDLGSLFGGKQSNAVANIPLPTFQTDQSYTDAQKQLADLGTGILSGNLPSFYSSLGKANSPQFQALEANTIGQTNNASAQQSAASGTDRSGVAATAAAGNLANVLPQMQYSDYLNAQQQQAGLLNTGIGVESGVRAAGFGQEGAINSFNQQNFQDSMQQAQYNNGWNAQQASQQGQAWGSILGAGLDIGLAPFTGGTSLMGLPGALGAGGGSGSSGMGASGLGALLSSLGQSNTVSPSSMASMLNVGAAVGGVA